ncbi:MAG TPA: hypothetical protein VHA75_19995 [Rugosimonospora sp.]|nr:hypothetical protein [Rugosimonospora sp.]
MTTRVVVISGSVGAGHDGVAAELARRMRSRGWEVTRYDFVELLGRRAGRIARRLYAAELTLAPATWGWLMPLLGRRRVAATLDAVLYRLGIARTRAAVRPAPDLVVSVYPAASQLLGRMRRDGELAAPVVTFLTDMSVHPLWVADGVDLHLALHDEAAARARAAGAARVRVAGAAVPPRFTPDGEPGERAYVRTRHGIPADRPAVLIAAGSWGVGDVLASAADVAASGLAVPVVLCGTNARLRDALRDRRLGVALGWVDDLAPLIRSCDAVLQNAGGLTSLEALACGVPLLSYRCLPGHGSTNAAALRDAGLAPWPQDAAELATELGAALRAGREPVPPLVRADPTEVFAELVGPVPVVPRLAETAGVPA